MLKEFIKNYADHVIQMVQTVDFAAVEKATPIFLEARQKGSTVFVAGNGGSAATANHFANDLIWGTRGNKMPDVRAMSLSANSSSISALGNDAGYENIFTEQMRSLFRPGDVLVAISASGNSPNILKAIQYANEHDGISVGLAGFDGGRMKDICQALIHVVTPRGEYCPVEDTHMIICHIITSYLKHVA